MQHFVGIRSPYVGVYQTREQLYQMRKRDCRIIAHVATPTLEHVGSAACIDLLQLKLKEDVAAAQ